MDEIVVKLCDSIHVVVGGGEGVKTDKGSPAPESLECFVYFLFLLVRRRELQADIVDSLLGLLFPPSHIKGHAIDDDFAFMCRGFGVVAFVWEQGSRIVFLLLIAHIN